MTLSWACQIGTWLSRGALTRFSVNAARCRNRCCRRSSIVFISAGVSVWSLAFMNCTTWSPSERATVAATAGTSSTTSIWTTADCPIRVVTI